MKIIEIRKVEDHTHLKAVATISLYDKVEITGFSVIRQDNGTMSVGLPQVKWVRDGKIYKKTLLKIPNDLRKLIKTEVLAAWKSLEGGLDASTGV